MNGVQLTFFNFSGYLIPGIIMIMIIVPAFFVYPEWKMAILEGLSHSGISNINISGGAIVAALFIPALGLAFLIGVVLSDIVVWLMSIFFVRVWRKKEDKTDNYFSKMLAAGRKSTVKEDFMAREIISLMATGSWDQYGFAGRARLSSASGGAMIVGSFLYVWASLWISLVLIVSGACLVALGRSLYCVYNDHCDVLAFLEETKDQPG